LASRAVSKSDAAFILPGTALVLPPDTAAILGHAVDDLLGTLDGFELDDGVVAEAQLLHVTLNLRQEMFQ